MWINSTGKEQLNFRGLGADSWRFSFSVHCDDSFNWGCVGDKKKKTEEAPAIWGSVLDTIIQSPHEVRSHHSRNVTTVIISTESIIMTFTSQ
jgi:hypothetical protein